MGLFSKLRKSVSKMEMEVVDNNTVPLYIQKPYIDATFGNVDFATVGECPEHIDKLEWIANNTVHFVFFITEFFSIISEECKCSSLNEFQWDEGKKPLKIPAGEYYELAKAHLQKIIDDKTIFPVTLSTPFPSDFETYLASIYKHLARLINHIYVDHYEAILHLGLEAHLNTTTAHILYFGLKNNYLEKRDLVHLKDLIVYFEAKNWRFERDQS